MEMFSTLRKPKSGSKTRKALRAALMVGFTLCMAFTQIFAQDKTDCPDGAIRYYLGNTQTNSHGLYFKEFFTQGDDSSVTLEFQEGSCFTIYANGYAEVKGTVKFTKDTGPADDLWKVKMRFKYVNDSIPKTTPRTLPGVTESWRYFRFLTKGSYMVKVGDKTDKVIFKEMPRFDRHGTGNYPLQVGDQASVLATGERPGNYGASTWFFYSRDGGENYYQGDINVVLTEKCNEIKPIEFEGICSYKVAVNRWKVTNHNKRSVLLRYVNNNGETKHVAVRGYKDGMPGMKTFCTPVSQESITLEYAIGDSLGSHTAEASAELCDYKDIELESVCAYNPKLRRWKIRNYNKYGFKVQVKVVATGETKLIHVGGTRGKVDYKDRYFTFKTEDYTGANTVEITYPGQYREDVVKTMDSNNEICPVDAEIIAKGYCDDSRRKPRNRWVFENENDYNVWVFVKGFKGGKWIHIPKSSRGGKRVIYTSADKNTLEYAYNKDGEYLTVESFPCKPAPKCVDGYKTYYLSSYSQNGHSVWLKGFKGQNRKLHFGEGAYLVYQKDYESGFLYGEIVNEFYGETGWKVYAKFVEAGDNVGPKHEKGGTHPVTGNKQRDLSPNWNYLLFEKGYIKSKDGSKVIELCAMPNNYGFQIGYSANGKNWEFGGSTWFHWKYDGDKNQGDFNLNMEDACIIPDVCTDEIGVYHVSSHSYNSRGHSLVLTNFSMGGTQRLHFVEGAYLAYDKMHYSTGFMAGEISNQLIGETGWKVTAYFKKAKNGVQPKYELGSKNGDGLYQRDIAYTWTYLDFDYGILENADGSKVVKLTAMDNPYGMQMGAGANGKNWEQGASTWIHWEYNGVKGKGDFNLILKNICEDDEAACKFTITEENGRVGDMTTILLAEKDYCGPAWYTIICPQTGESNTYKVHVGYGVAKARLGFSNLQSEKTYVMKLRTKKKVYLPIRFIKK